MIQKTPLRTLAAVAIALLFVSSAAAADWQYEDMGVPIAYADNGRAQFQFACRGGDLTVAFWVRAPHKQVASAGSMNLAIAPDPSGNGMSGASFAQDMPLIHSDGTSMVIRGPVAQRWARLAQQARAAIRVAYIRKHDKMEIFDTNDFGAKGSSAAITKVLDRCG